MKELKIGNVKIGTPLVLGPMAGVTDLPFRLLCREQGAGLAVTEMVSAKAILYHNRNTRELMTIVPADHPVSLQLFGSEPEVMAEAAAMVEEEIPFDILDINMGCPVPKVVNNGEGSALMRDPARAAAIVRAVSDRIGKPVTAKIRKGFDMEHVNAPEMAKALEQAGASAIAVHGRTRSQYYAGQADWEIIRQVKEAVSIPVIGNGDVDSPQTAAQMLKETGVDGVMVARAAEGNPWIFSRIRTYLETGKILPDPTAEEVYEMAVRHGQMMIEYKGAYTGSREMRKHLSWYTAGFPHSASLRKRINAADTFEEMQQILYETLIGGQK